MYVFGWSFTGKCNLKCVHCYNASGKKSDDELSYEQKKKVAQKIIDFGVDAVNFGGGECPLDADFLEICGLLHKAGIKLSLTTNGLTYKSVAKHLHLFYDIGVSIDFADEEKHDRFRGVPGAYRRALEAIRFFVSKGVNVEIVTCLTKLNCAREELEELYALAGGLKVHSWRLNKYRPTGRAGMQEALRLSPQDLKRAFEFLDEKSGSDFVMPDSLFGIFGRKTRKCPCGRTSLRIQPNGEVSPCIFLKRSGGNVLEKSFEDIFDSDIFREIRGRSLAGTKCEVCSHRSRCKGGCAGAAYLEHGTFDRPDPLCWVEPEWNVHEMYLCTAYVPIEG